MKANNTYITSDKEESSSFASDRDVGVIKIDVTDCMTKRNMLRIGTYQKG
jgi:hypothetical protein